jgi:hypothetical protein
MIRPTPPAALFAASLTILTVACSSAPEQPILNQFFTASRLRDNTSLENFATVSFDPRTAGIVSSFTIESVGPEQRKPVNLKALGKAVDTVKAEDNAFTKRKIEYQNDNLDAIHRVLQAERDKTKVKGKDAEVQAAWTKFREEGTQMQKKVAEAKSKLASESALVELSVSDPRNPINLTKYDGDLVTKEVTVSASVKPPSGQTVPKTLIVTMRRAMLKGDHDVTGRWIITGVKDTAVPAGTKTS